MAIRKNKTTKPEEATETQEDAANTEASQPVETTTEETPTEETPAEAKPETKAVVPKQAAAPPAQLVNAPSLMSLRNAMDPNEIGNVFKRLVGSNGAIMESQDKYILGSYVDVQILSTSDRWFVTPDADMKKDPESSAFCRASYDGKTIQDGDGNSMTIEEYTDSIQEYDFNEPKKYLDIFALVIHTQDVKMEDDALAWGIVQISLSPTAVKGYRAFEMQGKLNVARGVVKPNQQNCVRFTAKIKSSKTNTWTAIEAANIPHADIVDYVPIDMSE